MTHHGSCHCGSIEFEVQGTIDSVLDCNCTMCRRRGGLLWMVPGAAFKLITPQSSLSTYRFNKKHIQHRFCATCGIAPFGEGGDGKGNTMVAVNVRCLDMVDLKALKVVEYDGLSL
jgi:hypothetical protein